MGANQMFSARISKHSRSPSGRPGASFPVIGIRGGGRGWCKFDDLCGKPPGPATVRLYPGLAETAGSAVPLLAAQRVTAQRADGYAAGRFSANCCASLSFGTRPCGVS